MKELSWEQTKRFFWLALAMAILGALSSCSSTAQPFKNYNQLGETYHTVSNTLLHVKNLKFIEGSDTTLKYTHNYIEYLYSFNKGKCVDIKLFFYDFMDAENFVGIFKVGLIQMSDRLWVTDSLAEKRYLVLLSYSTSKTIFEFKKLQIQVMKCYSKLIWITSRELGTSTSLPIFTTTSQTTFLPLLFNQII